MTISRNPNNGAGSMNSTAVSDLNGSEQVCQPVGAHCAGGWHERWQDLVRSDAGIFAMEDVPSHRGALWGRLSRPNLDLCRTVPLYGLRAAHVPREPTRHRSLSVGARGQAVSHGLSVACESFDVGGCERTPRLADLCRLCPGPDRPGPEALCPRRLRCGVDQHRLCLGCHDDRSVPVDVPLGAFSHHQSRGEAAHAARSARQPSEVSATTAGRLNKAGSNRLWKEQAVWRAEHPHSWWQSVPRTWIRPLVSDQPPVITPGPSLSRGAH